MIKIKNQNNILLFKLFLKLLNVSIIVSFVFVIFKSYQYYNCLINRCFFLGSPPENFVLFRLIAYTGIMLLLPVLLLLIRYIILKKSSKLFI
jgi:hypothetical protein